MLNCPRAMSEFVYFNKPQDDCCSQCGSLLPDLLMQRLEAGDVSLSPTDKDYKVYVINKSGKLFKICYRTDNSGTMDQLLWTWETKEVKEIKFYFQHLSKQQQERFLELYNKRLVVLDYPGRFYKLPYFCKEVENL